MTQCLKELNENFFSTESLVSLLPYFCKNNYEIYKFQNIDVISRTILIFLTTPLQLVIDSFGICLFYGESNMILPFTHMSEKQRKCIARVCLLSSEYNIINSKIVFKRSSPHTTIPMQNILEAFCQIVFQSSKYSNSSTRLSICNIILQRIQGFLPISNSIQKDLNKWMKELHNTPKKEENAPKKEEDKLTEENACLGKK